MKKCHVCEKGILDKAEDIVLEIEGYVFIIKGERCSNCSEEFPYEEETKKTIEVAKKMGIWPEPLKLSRHLSKSGGGLILRIPSDIEKQLKLKEKMLITISKIGNKLVLEPEE